jgi:hypothetical protein
MAPAGIRFRPSAEVSKAMLIHRQGFVVCAMKVLLLAFRKKAFPLLRAATPRPFLENAD